MVPCTRAWGILFSSLAVVAREQSTCVLGEEDRSLSANAHWTVEQEYLAQEAVDAAYQVHGDPSSAVEKKADDRGELGYGEILPAGVAALLRCIGARPGQRYYEPSSLVRSQRNVRIAIIGTVDLLITEKIILM